jgi:heat shock protein HslJ
MNMKKTIPILFLLVFTAFSCSKKTMNNTLNQAPDASLTNTRWKLIKLPGLEIHKLDKDAFIQFTTENNRAFGSGGCNNMRGSYSVIKNTLKIGPMASTMMACTPEIMLVESAFSKALTETDNYIISGDSLKLRKGDKVLAELAALYLQ